VTRSRLEADAAGGGGNDDLLDGFPIRVEIPVAWGDMDAFGHVNNTVYFRWFETARIAFLEAIGFTAGGESGEVGPILGSTQCRFRRPVAFPDTVTVGVRATAVDKDRFTHTYRVVSRGAREVVAEGSAVVVSYDYGLKTKTPIPSLVRGAIDRLAR
jgi:acyl-CoA thioester hydrolase